MYLWLKKPHWCGWESTERREFTFLQMKQESARFANVLQSLRLGKGDRIFTLTIYWCTADPGWVTGTSYGITNIVDESEFNAKRWYKILQPFLKNADRCA